MSELENAIKTLKETAYNKELPYIIADILKNNLDKETLNLLIEKLNVIKEVEPKTVKLPTTDDGLKNYIPPSKPQQEYYNITIDEAEIKPSDEKMSEWYYLRLDDEIIDKTKLFQKYDLNWCVKADTLTYTTKKGIKNSRKVYGKAENIQSLCDLFLLINSKTKAIEALTVGEFNLDWLKTRAKNDDVVLYGGILVADDYYVNFVCEYNPNSDLFYSIER